MLRMKFNRNLIRCLMVVVVMLFVGAITSPAFAYNPTTWTITDNGSYVDKTICPFNVKVEFTATQTLTAYLNDDGTWRMGHHVSSEQEIFSANGKTIVGDEYHFTIHNKFDPNNPTSVLYGSYEGIVEQVHLPDGGVMLISGRLEWGYNFTNQTFIGNPGDWAPLCAALAR